YIYSAQKDIISNMAYTKVVGKAIKSVTGIDGEYPKMEDISKFLGTILKGETVSMVLEDSTSKTYDFTITKNSETGLFGITILKSFKVTEAPSVTVKNVYTLGPSGGAMQALYIYMVMSGEDILKGRNIAGTGTIGHQTLEDGTTIFNKIGAIGCVGQKLYSAYKDKATIFYCPESNYDECMTYYKKYGFTEDMIRVVKVSTLTDIIDDLRGTN
ncbi:MAG: hypothetical protein K6G38_02350, partial [Gammaproteobacteria bacterium]|nr:hypothetical protein [Gammaproteobacteria bacterium]